MRIALSLIALTLFSASAQAAEVLSGRFDSDTDDIVLRVRYTGGCEVHSFSLGEIDCDTRQSSSCETELIETTPQPDLCEALITRTVRLDAPEFDEGTFLTIRGDENTAVTVFIPD